MNCPMCPAWMGGGMALGLIIGVLIVVLLVTLGSLGDFFWRRPEARIPPPPFLNWRHAPR
jgi:hypothetical protein